MAKEDGLETRFLAGAELMTEARIDQGEGPKLQGYAALFNKPTEIMPGFFERIAPGAFARALKEKQDVRALVDHENSKVLGRTTAGTLDLSENRKGLKTLISPPDTQVGRDIVISVERGDVDQMSFAFRAVKETWEDHKDGSSTRTLEDVDLFDVSIVTFAAYPDTTIAVRAYEERKAKLGHRSDIDRTSAAKCPRLARCKRILAETLTRTNEADKLP
jgi:HK97 family phage prohead protease